MFFYAIFYMLPSIHYMPVHGKADLKRLYIPHRYCVLNNIACSFSDIIILRCWASIWNYCQSFFIFPARKYFAVSSRHPLTPITELCSDQISLKDEMRFFFCSCKVLVTVWLASFFTFYVIQFTWMAYNFWYPRPYAQLVCIFYQLISW
jgi:hypothetical protein